MNKSPKFSTVVRERAVRMLQEHREKYTSLWAAAEYLALKISCVAHALYKWMREHEVDSGTRQGTADKDQLRELGHENRELRKTSEILKLARAFFAEAEIDRSLKS